MTTVVDNSTDDNLQLRKFREEQFAKIAKCDAAARELEKLEKQINTAADQVDAAGIKLKQLGERRTQLRHGLERIERFKQNLRNNPPPQIVAELKRLGEQLTTLTRENHNSLRRLEYLQEERRAAERRGRDTAELDAAISGLEALLEEPRALAEAIRQQQRELHKLNLREVWPDVQANE